MWEHGGFMESVLEDALAWCVLVNCHDIGICKLWGRGQGIATIPTNATGRCAAKHCYFLGVAECMCQYSGTWRCQSYTSRSFKAGVIQMYLLGIALLTCVQNVGAWRMHIECYARHAHMMWFLGLLCLGMLRKLLHILNRRVKKVSSQIMSLLFVTLSIYVF